MTQLNRVKDLTYEDLKKKYDTWLTLTSKVIFWIFLWAFVIYAYNKDPTYGKFVSYFIASTFFVHIIFWKEIYKRVEKIHNKMFSKVIESINKDLKKINNKAMEKAIKDNEKNTE